MKPRIKLASTKTPDGGDMVLYQHDQDFIIQINGHELMSSRQHESELELARLGCAHVVDRKSPNVLIGGLGLGYTLRQTLDMLSPHANIAVCELLSDVVTWNHTFLAELNSHPLNDPRVSVQQCDIMELLGRSKYEFDVIMLDVDNGPSAISDSGNRHLYNREGIETCCKALRDKGCLAVWSGEPNKDFERLMMSCGLHVRRYRAPAYKGSKSLSRYVWVAALDKSLLPPGGGEPRVAKKRSSRTQQRRGHRARR